MDDQTPAGPFFVCNYSCIKHNSFCLPLPMRSVRSTAGTTAKKTAETKPNG